MTTSDQNRIKELLPVIQAYAEGKTIESKTHSDKWCKVSAASFSKPADWYRVARPCIVINGWDVPRPLTLSEVRVLDHVYVPNIIDHRLVHRIPLTHPGHMNFEHRRRVHLEALITKGLVHATIENALMHAKALLMVGPLSSCEEDFD